MNAERSHYEAPSTTLVDYVEQSTVKAIHFIKCDIEGAELLSFRRGATTLERYKPIILFEYFEEWTRHFNYSASERADPASGEVRLQVYLFDDFSELSDPATHLEKVRVSVNVICSARSLS